MPRHPRKTTLIQGASSIGKTYALRRLAEEIKDQVTLLTTTGELGFEPFSLDAVRTARTAIVAIDEIANVGEMTPEVFAAALEIMNERSIVEHLLLVTWNEKAARDEGFVFPRGTKTVSMRARRSELSLTDGVVAVTEPQAQVA